MFGVLAKALMRAMELARLAVGWESDPVIQDNVTTAEA